MDGKLKVAFFLSTLLVTLTVAQTEPSEETPTAQGTPSLLQDFFAFAQRATASDIINQQRDADTFVPIQDRPVLLSDFVQFATGALARGVSSEGPSVTPTNEQPTDQTPPVLLTDLVEFVQNSMATNRQDANFAPAEAASSGSTVGTGPVLLADLVQFVGDARKASMTTGEPTPANSMTHLVNDATAPEKTTIGNANPIDPENMPVEKFRDWLNNIKPATAPEKTTIGNADPFDPENMPVEKFRDWLNNIKPATTNKTADIETQTPDMQVAHTMASPQAFWTRNMIIIVAVVGSTTLLCITLLTLVCVMRRRSGLSKKERDLMDKTFNSRPLGAFSTIGSKNMDLFMGIPANNEIWRDLQTLPKSASDSSVVSQ